MLMQASIVDLRYHMSEIKKAIGNNQIISITDRGKIIADIFPRENTKKILAEEHPFFSSTREDTQSVTEVMTALRKGRYDAL